MLHGYLSHVYADLVSPPLSADVTLGMGAGRDPAALSGNDPWLSCYWCETLDSQSSGGDNNKNNNDYDNKKIKLRAREIIAS